MLDGLAAVTRTAVCILALIAAHRSQLLTQSAQPLLHTTVFLLQIMAVSLIARKYNGYYAKRPVLTTMITNAVSDPSRLAQRILHAPNESHVELDNG